MDKYEGNKFFRDPGNDRKMYWDAIRNRKHSQSFPLMADWIRNTNKVIRAARTRKIKRRRKLAWLSISCLFIFFIVSCTYRVERVEKSGSLVNFGIDKREKRSFQRLTSLQQSLAFTPYEFLRAGDAGIAWFIFFVSDKEQEKLMSITRELRLLSGLRKLDISSVNYNIRESLFSTFLHKTLRVGKHEKLNGKDLVRNIRAVLDKKGFGFLSADALNDTDQKVSFSQILFTNTSGSDTSTVKVNTASESTGLPTNTRPHTHKETEKLQMFNWLLGTWKVKYVPHRTYHHWLRMNDSSLACFIIKYEDDEPEISIGFSLKYSSADSAILSLRGIEWKFISGNNKEINFKNEITPKSANVKWRLDNEKKAWQSAISGERNLEVVNLIRNEDTNLENIVKDFITKHPGKTNL